MSAAEREDGAKSVVRPAWPLLPITDERNRSLGWACLNGPLRNPEERARLARVRRRYRLVGMTSYLSFPSMPAADQDYAVLCEGWCHCFRDPDAYLPAGMPRVLLPYSDFLDPWQSLVARLSGSEPKERDFLFVCPEDPWKERSKNWPLARRCFGPLCADLGLRGLVVGHTTWAGFSDHGGRLTTCPELPWSELLQRISTARFLLVTSLEDPSPRLIAEALALGTPVLVNAAILGGWHYVNEFTGGFFEDELDVAVGARRVLERSTSPREWFRTHHGPRLAGAKLARFLRELDPTLEVREARLSLRMEDDV
jgi:glycosyltransferase involved in cell wall biosynthesis